ncbi:MAG TPA: creatininase family protein [Terriglobales bacterium]|nr:creatininase family protein [Terriglobales bacterium]
MKKILIDEMSWPEVKAALDSGCDTVIICAASSEQHGPHMAESTDAVIGAAQSEALAHRLGYALVAPIVRPGLSDHHMALPGSITLRPETFKMLLEDYVSAFVRHGFKNIVLLSSHGGNFAAVAKLAEELDRKYAAVKVVSGIPIEALVGLLVEQEEAAGLPKATCGGHACAWETSVMLHLRPDLVNMDMAAQGFIGKVDKALTDRLFREGIVAMSPTGIIGDARYASADLGKLFFNGLVDILEADVRRKLGK